MSPNLSAKVLQTVWARDKANGATGPCKRDFYLITDPEEYDEITAAKADKAGENTQKRAEAALWSGYKGK